MTPSGARRALSATVFVLLCSTATAALPVIGASYIPAKTGIADIRIPDGWELLAVTWAPCPKPKPAFDLKGCFVIHWSATGEDPDSAWLVFRVIGVGEEVDPGAFYVGSAKAANGDVLHVYRINL